MTELTHCCTNTLYYNDHHNTRYLSIKQKYSQMNLESGAAFFVT